MNENIVGMICFTIIMLVIFGSLATMSIYYEPKPTQNSIIINIKDASPEVIKHIEELIKSSPPIVVEKGVDK